MKRYFGLIAAALAVFTLAGCLGGAFTLGSAANPPTDVKVVAGDGSVTVTWTMSPNVQYWVFSAMADAITTETWSKLLSGRATIKATSPQMITGLANDFTYSFTVNGRIDGGAGGPGSPSVSVMPRLAGNTWSIGKALPSDLRSVAFGAVFVTVGASGTIYSSPDFNTWTPVTWTAVKNPLVTLPDLNAIAFGSTNYLAAGAGGSVLLSTDAVTWTAQTTGTTNTLYALTNNGTASAIAAGANGTIITSADGKTWTTANSGTTNDLFGLAYGNAVYVAVGAKGTMLTSVDGTTWLSAISNTTQKLTSIVYGINTTTGLGTFVAVGEAGTMITSTDGTTWTVQTSVTANNLASITYGKRFVAVGDKGTILTSSDGSTWQTQSSGTSDNLTSVGRSQVGYSAVGTNGTNLSSI